MRPIMKPLLLATAAGVALTLAACEQKPATPAAEAPAGDVAVTVAEDVAPTVEDLPDAPPAPVAPVSAPAPSRDYWEAVETADNRYTGAPDYAYEYDGAEPVYWEEEGYGRRVLERLPGGGERYYYYRDGYDEPWFVRDPD